MNAMTQHRNIEPFHVGDVIISVEDDMTSIITLIERCYIKDDFCETTIAGWLCHDVTFWRSNFVKDHTECALKEYDIEDLRYFSESSTFHGGNVWDSVTLLRENKVIRLKRHIKG
jgi:hypothetical protein